MYRIIKRKHDLPYFAGQTGSVLSWTNKREGAKVLNLRQAICLYRKLRILTLDNTITSERW